jgi:hypothetical protein
MRTGFKNRRPAIIRGFDPSELYALGGEEDDCRSPHTIPRRSPVDPTIRRARSHPPKDRALDEVLGQIPVEIEIPQDSTMILLTGGTESNFLSTGASYGFSARHGTGEGPDFSDRLSRDHELVIETICSVGGMPG